MKPTKSLLNRDKKVDHQVPSCHLAATSPLAISPGFSLPCPAAFVQQGVIQEGSAGAERRAVV